MSPGDEHVPDKLKDEVITAVHPHLFGTMKLNDARQMNDVNHVFVAGIVHHPGARYCNYYRADGNNFEVYKHISYYLPGWRKKVMTPTY